MQTKIEGFRLSRQQRSLWSLSQDNAVYLTQGALLIEGKLDVGLLKETLQRIVRRHQILRTTFHRLPGMKAPVQVIADNGLLLWSEIDLSDLEAAQREARVEELYAEEGRRPAAPDVSQTPLLRSTLLVLAPERHVLLISLPALCADAWTFANLVEEIGRGYAASLQGEDLAEQVVQYVQFSEWQHSLAEGEDAGLGRAYWEEQALAAQRAPRLPFEGAASGQPGSRPDAFGRVDVSLEPELVARIETAAAHYETTPAIFLLTCWQTLLWRLTGETDVAVSHVYDGRGFEMLDGAFGLFAESLPLHGHFEGSQPFGEILGQIDATVQDGADWQIYYPWEESLDAQRATNGAGAPIGFEFTEWPAKQRVDGLCLSVQKQDSVIGRFKLWLSCAWVEGAVVARFRYDPALFQAEDVRRLAGYFVTLVESAAQNPEAPAGALELLSAADRRQLLVAFNDTAAPFPEDKCIHQLFEAQAARVPNNPAVVFEDRQLSYAELNAQANQLAHYLRRRGVGPDVRVALCVERSVEMLVGLLGILKAGGAYVPLNPDHPPARLAHQIAEIETPVVLTQKAYAGQLPEFQGEVICLDTDQALFAQESEANPEPITAPHHAVYVIYTSGSTGLPKGVVVTHRSLVNYAHFLSRRLRLDEEPNRAGLHFATVSTITADLGNTSIFGALVSGGCLHVLSYEVATDGDKFAAYLARHPIDVLKIVPSHFSALLASRPDGANGHCLPRKYLILGGEALSFELVRRVASIAADCQVINHYGPTEATIGCLTYDVSGNSNSAAPGLSATAPIGRPIANTEIYILDEHRQPAPLGVPGELYIGGAGLAQGYLNRPDLTEERFVPNPFYDFELPNLDFGSGTGDQDNPMPNAQYPISNIQHPKSPLLYKTGDLVRYLPGGDVEFLGRTDHQVKVRGYRVELEEIEVILGQHPAVRQAVVLARDDERVPGQKQLVAYVVAGRTPAPGINDLYDYLRSELPDYMVPSAFVLLDALPLTPNGKVDRKALPAPDAARLRSDGAFVAPRTPTEELLAGIWAGVLGVARVGAEDNFFALGGHSLLAMRVAARIRETFQVDLPLRNLFESPTVAGLAREIEQAGAAKQKVRVPPILPVPRDRELPLSFAQQRLWFLDQLVPNNSFYNVPVAIRLAGDLNVEALERAIAEIVRRHEVLRTTYQTVDGQPVQVISEAGAFALPVTDLRHLPDDEREVEARRLATEEARRPFDLARGPLFRVTLLRLGDEDHVLVATLHHIVSDVWSRGVLIQEVATLYRAFTEGRPSPLPDLPVQYADYAFWQRQWLAGEVYEQQLAYWRQQLGGGPSVLALPTDRPRPAAQTFRGADLAQPLPEALGQAVIDLSRREGVTPFMAMLAAFQALLYRYTGQEQINVGSPVAGRTRPETQGMIGFFLNTLVFRADFSGNPTFRQLLRQVREVSLEAYAHQDLPFEQLVEALQPERNMGHSPLFQVSFVMINAGSEALELPGLRIQPLNVEGNTARHDLTFFIIEGRDGFTANVEYSTDLFDRSTIARLLEHFTHLLESLVATPDQRISALPLMPEAEAERLLVAWNQTAVEYPLDQPLHRLIEAQAARTPEAVAVVFPAPEQSEAARLTYGELNRRANQLAHHLQKLGVGPEVLVGICMERSLEMMVALLGVLKAGGAYVPLDPSYPLDRLAFMLADSGTPVLLTQPRLVETLGAAEGASGSDLLSIIERQCQVVYLDPSWQAIAQESEESPAGGVSSENTAYVIYTSGSTGRPKGVMAPHRAIANHMLWLRDHFALTESDRYLQKTAFSFDAAGTEFYAPLLTGGRLILARPGGRQDSAYLVELLREHEVTILQLVPSLLRVLLDEPAFGQCQALRRVICAGEALPSELLARFNALLPGAELHNFYGPTEAAIDVTFWPHAEANGRAIVPIGRPIANTQIYLLDAGLQPTPVGVPGELYIGGANLARGYLNRPDLTAEKFVPNPFVKDEGGRVKAEENNFILHPSSLLYKTGDLARYLPDGNIEFLGRIDHQVKVRGFRIELGEIEAVLGQHPAVRQAVVLAREDHGDDKRLVAYLVAGQEETPSVSDLRSFLKAQLPDYMVPGAFVWLESLPLTPNGKVDRRALPAPEQARPDLASAYVAPRSPIEEKLAEIGAQLLRVEKVGAYDNFFELGGHSLLATQFMSRLRDAFLVELPLRVLFEKPTIAEIAGEIERAQASGAELQTPAIKPISREARRVKRSEISS